MKFVSRLAVSMTVGFLMSLVASASFANEDRTIWLQPGQCIVLGSQQVCAAKGDATGPGAVVELENKQKHVCKDGIQDEADANLKGWAHVVITFDRKSGKKLNQEVVKTFGPTGKKACEASLKEGN